MRRGWTRLLAAATGLALAGCGGAAPPQVRAPSAQGAAGGEDEADPATPDPLADPCAPGEGSPCAEPEGDAGEGLAGGGEGGGEGGGDGGGGEGGGDGEGGGEGGGDGEGGAEPADPQVAHRESLSRGRRAFRRACDARHPNGEDDLGPTLRGIGWPADRRWRQIREGGGPMRPIRPSRLPDALRDDLMTYLSTMRAVRGVERPQ